MTQTDFLSILQWWLVFFIIGFSFFPITSIIFKYFYDKGYLFSKILGTLLITYFLYVLGTLRIIHFSQSNLYLVSLVIILISLIPILFKKNVSPISHFSKRKFFSLLALEELLFLSGLIFWSYIRGFQPDIIGLEKYMDYGFINSILKTDYFPVKDMWFAPYPINYYYFGHLYTALLTILSKLPSSITYNLMIATIFAFTLSLSFSIISNILYFFFNDQNKSLNKIYSNSFAKALVVGTCSFITSLIITLGGNLHTIYIFFLPYQNENPVPFWSLPLSLATTPNNYWYPNATRFIYNTIHEFPLYSFVVSDLHGHVLSIPIVLTILAFLSHVFLYKEKISFIKISFMSFLVACAYMTNALDGVVYILLTLLSFLVLFNIESKLDISFNSFKNIIKRTFIPALTLIVFFILFTLPFSLHFKSFVSGVGVLCAPEFLTNIGKVGPLLFESNHCQKSPFWQLFILHGFFYTWISIYFFIFWKSKKINRSDVFVLVLISMGTLLVILPEFIYFKDIYPAHYRANTMFKFVYQAFMMFSLVTGYSIFRTILTFRPALFPVVGIGLFMIFLVLLYPYFAINSYYNVLTQYKGLDGITYLKTGSYNDYLAIDWMRSIPGQPTILEAQGDSYTDFGRVSVHTGLPTVLGWTVHEWLWRGSYDIPAPRIGDIQLLYESTDISKTQELLKKYNISYVYVGTLEKQKYINLNEEKFSVLGQKVYSKNQVTIYKIN